MQLTGMLHGSKLLDHVGFPRSEILGPDASEDEIQALIDRHGLIFIKPVFRGGVGNRRHVDASARLGLGAGRLDVRRSGLRDDRSGRRLGDGRGAHGLHFRRGGRG